MTRSYIRLDPGLDERKHDYPLGAIATFVLTLCLAERQAHRGRFRSLDYLRRLLPKPAARHVNYLVEQSDLQVQEDGTVYVLGWDEWQEGDYTVTERMARVRAKRDGTSYGSGYGPRYEKQSDSGAVLGGHEAVPSGAGGDDIVSAYYALTLRFPRGKALEWLNDLERQYGSSAKEVLTIKWNEERELSTLLSRTTDALRLAAHRADRAEREDEEARNRAKRAPLDEPWRQEFAEALEKRQKEPAA